jgi:transposase
MAEKRTRRRFTAEFKAEAVKRLLDGGKGLGEVATELGLSPGQLSGWRNEHLAAGSAEALAAREAEQAELQRLKRENKRLEEEVEILKKAAPHMGCMRSSTFYRIISLISVASDPRLEPVLTMRQRRPHHLTSGRARCARAMIPHPRGRRARVGRDHPFSRRVSAMGLVRDRRPPGSDGPVAIRPVDDVVAPSLTP